MENEFQRIYQNHSWRPLFHCPGRYVLRGGPQKLSPQKILSADFIVKCFTSPKAKDRVWVSRISGGGLISYEKKGGFYIHTLCTEEGFQRKLRDLFINTELIYSFIK